MRCGPRRTEIGDGNAPATDGRTGLVKQQHQLFVALLATLDAIVVSAACYAAWLPLRLYFRAETGFGLPVSWESWIKEPLLPFAIPITLYAFYALGLYRPRRDRSLWGELGSITRAALAAIAGLVLALWAVGSDLIGRGSPLPTVTVFGQVMDAGRVQLGLLTVLLPLCLMAHRLAFRIGLRTLRRRGWNLRHVAIIGTGRLGQIACRTISRNSWTGIHVGFFISHHETTARETCIGRPVVGGLRDLEEILSQNKLDAVYICLPNAKAAKLPQVLKTLEKFVVDVRVIPDVQPRYLPQSMTVAELDGMPVLSYRECPTLGLGGFGKRIVDILGAAFALLLFSPVMLACAIAVRLSGPGPIIFKQRRVSLGGERFKIYKFRTMYHVRDESSPRPADDAWTTRNDPRVTPIGRFMRKTSLDELPQLLNVLKGDMSLVGPRPERPELIDRFKEDWRGYMLRQHVKAGITGWAQVNGLRGDTCLKKRLQHDLYYVRNWSLGFDIKILWLTLFRGFIHRNAH